MRQGLRMDERAIRARLEEGAASPGVPLTAGQADALMRYLAELLRWNARVNLTSITDPIDCVVKHFLDSLSLAKLLPDTPFKVADIGSGAGFPGLVLKVVRPDMDLTLVEPARKKGNFLKHIIRTLGLQGVQVYEGKVVQLAVDCPGSFDMILSRAFKEPGELLPLVGPLLRTGGVVAQSLGPGASAEPPAGWSALPPDDITLPFSDYKRRLVLFEKM